MKSASSSAASARSATSLSVIAGSSGRAKGDVDALARPESTDGDRPRDDLTGAERVDHQARHPVTDHDLRTLGDQPRKVRENRLSPDRFHLPPQDRRTRPARPAAASSSAFRPTVVASALADRTAAPPSAPRARPRPARLPSVAANHRPCRASSSAARSPSRQPPARPPSHPDPLPVLVSQRSSCAWRTSRSDASRIVSLKQTSTTARPPEPIAARTQLHAAPDGHVDAHHRHWPRRFSGEKGLPRASPAATATPQGHSRASPAPGALRFPCFAAECPPRRTNRQAWKAASRTNPAQADARRASSANIAELRRLVRPFERHGPFVTIWAGPSRPELQWLADRWC